MASTDNERLKRQIAFVVEIDKLKEVYRQTLLMSGKRYENDAEHSWHLGIMVVLLSEYAGAEQIDLLRVLKIVLLHDLVEIDAGDTFCYDKNASVGKYEREKVAANRIFGILPQDQAAGLMELWEEFEARQSPEARYAAALDRLQPILHNYNTKGAAWKKHGVTADRVLERNRHIGDASPKLWEFAQSIINDAVEKGFLEPGPRV